MHWAEINYDQTFNEKFNIKTLLNFDKQVFFKLPKGLLSMLTTYMLYFFGLILDYLSGVSSVLDEPLRAKQAKKTVDKLTTNPPLLHVHAHGVIVIVLSCTCILTRQINR